ncbi:MAG: hypothetical protein JRN39_07885 [Nitrososphaerota archaeon]|nr:hypothetical protein [Nitrososphaerota archaeon]
MARVFAPTAVSCFFTVEGLDENGRAVRPLQLVGAKGGGFKLALGTVSEVRLARRDSVYFNGRRREGSTTHTLAGLVRERLGVGDGFEVRHRVPVPVGCGFGTSASASLGAAVGMLLALGRRSTLKLPAQLAHEAEILARTGLGTVGSLYASSGSGGLITRAGGPGVCELQPFLERHSRFEVVAVTLGPRPKGPILTSKEYIRAVNREGNLTLQRVMESPSSEAMVRESRRFAQRTGLLTGRVAEICAEMEKRGALAATQNMIGDAAHGIVESGEGEEVAARMRKAHPSASVVVTPLCEGGVRIEEG